MNQLKDFKPNLKYIFIAILVFFVCVIVLFHHHLWLPSPKKSTSKLLKKPEISEKKINEAIDVCGRIQDKELRKVCINITKGNANACETSGAERVPNCHTLLALRLGDERICEKSKLDKSECFALVSKDYEKCKDSNFPENCYRKIALMINDPKGCDYISRQLDCNLCKAEVEKNPDYCIYPEKLTEPRDFCYIEIAALLGDISICKRIEDEKRKNLCMSMAERKKGNINCEECIWCCDFLAALTGDISLCRDRDICYWNVTLKLLNLLPIEMLF